MIRAHIGPQVDARSLDTLNELLAARVEEFNGSTDAAERVTLYQQIQTLRQKIDAKVQREREIARLRES